MLQFQILLKAKGKDNKSRVEVSNRFFYAGNQSRDWFFTLHVVALSARDGYGSKKRKELVKEAETALPVSKL